MTKIISASATLLLLMLLIGACAAPTSPTANTEVEGAATSDGGNGATQPELRIGYQRGGAWTLVKARRALEERLGPDVNVTWTLFTSGPPLLEAMNAGAIDIGSTGETPPIFAQAAGTPLLYLAYLTGSGAGSALVVSSDSTIQSLDELRGKKIAFAKASSSHLLLIKALQKERLTYEDIEPVFLQPPEARAALEGGSVDAWIVWNPFLEAAIQELGARIVVSGGDIAPTKSYVLGQADFVAQHPEIAQAVVEEVRDAQIWARDNVEEYATILEQETGIAASVWIGAFDRETPEYGFMDEAAFKHQQEVADIFYELELIPESLTIADSVWCGPQD